MGVEYYIRHHPTDRVRWEEFVRTLHNPSSPTGWPDFSVQLTDRDIYFCDNGRSESAAIALRRIIDWVLSQTASVTIEEA